MTAMFHFFLENYETHYQRHLRGTLQLKILRKWINIGANSFLVKIIMKRKLTEMPGKQSVASNSKNIAPK